ncbi:MAG: Crp/Fnr family transcriptional regulator [Pseudomonadota bacterium]
MSALITLLEGFLPLGVHDRELVLRHAVPARAGKGDHLYHAGKPVERIFLLHTGLARVYYVHEDREVNLRLLCDASVLVPLSALITGTPSAEHIQALADCEGWFLPLGALERDGMDALVLERCRRLMAEQHYLSMERRLRMLQHKSAEERWQAFRNQMPDKIVRDTPGYHVASYLGITPESLSRVRRTAF